MNLMVKKLITALSLAVLCLISVPATAQMTDEAVYSYVKDGLANGKSQEVLIKELIARGVTKEQALRIQNTLQGKNIVSAAKTVGAQERSRRMTSGITGLESEGLNLITGEIQNMPDSLFMVGPENEVKPVMIYGQNIFNNQELTFSMNENIATPENYKLAAGDEVIIDIWGANENNIRQVISPDGFITISGVGLVYLSGMTIKEAEAYVRRQLGKIYSVSGEDARSDIKLTLGALRTIQVNVMGEVRVPGTYFVSSLSSVYHALYKASGFTELGSLRNIQLIRNGKTIAVVDVYDFIAKGIAADDVILQDGDIVLVPTYEMIVDLQGFVKRPMMYEMKNGETVQNLLDFAGGFKGDAYKANINMVRRNGREYQIYTVDSQDYSSFELMDADSLTVGQIINKYENRLEVVGAVYRPGIYQLSEKINTVTKLIEVADGVKGDAFLNRAMIHRERPDYTLEVLSFDLGAILNGTQPDVELKENDVLYISSIHALNDIGNITVSGEVANPGEFIYAANTTLEDIIMQAGGLLESASTSKIDISRRVKDSGSLAATNKTSEIFTIEFKDGYAVDGQEGFVLQPYDVVYVRHSPAYFENYKAHVYGEVVFPGEYSLEKKDTRLSDLIALAGGVNDLAYVKGARLRRSYTPEEKARIRTTQRTLSNTRDSLDLSGLDIYEGYYVGINLEEALANPGSDADILVREDDILLVPERINTVKISGNVLYPNVVAYNSKLKVKDYVDLAGGYGFNSKKSRAYVIYINGTVARAKKNSSDVVHPGSEIIVPEKFRKEGNLEKILSVATTSSSLATMLATVGNIILNATK